MIPDDDLSPEDRAIADRIADLPDEPLPEGAEERLLERFRRERGRTIRSLPDVLAVIDRVSAAIPTPDGMDRYEALVAELAEYVLGSPQLLREATIRAYESGLVLDRCILDATERYLEDEATERGRR